MAFDKIPNKGLGRGLSALLGDDANETQSPSTLTTPPTSTPSTQQVLLIPLSQLESNSEQPRKHFDSDSLQELADSIRIHGVLQPITVRRLPSGRYQIIAGDRRYRASRLAGLSQIPAQVISADDKTVMELALIENLQRENLNPLEEAQGYRALMDECSLTQDEVSTRVGKSRSSVANVLRLLSLPSDIQSHVQQGNVSAGHARALLSLPIELQLSLTEEIIAMGLSVRETESKVKLLLSDDKQKSKTETEKKAKKRTPLPEYLSRAERDFSAYFGRKVKISQGKRKGKIELEFSGQDDIDALLALLSTQSAE